MQCDYIFFIFIFLQLMVTYLFLCLVFTVPVAKFSTLSNSLSTLLFTRLVVQEHNFSVFFFFFVVYLSGGPSSVWMDYSIGCLLVLPETSPFRIILDIPLPFLGHFPCYVDLLSFSSLVFPFSGTHSLIAHSC